LHRLGLVEESAGEKAVFPRDPLIELHPESHVSDGEPIGAGNHEFQLAGKKRSVVQHVNALVKRTVHHFVLRGIEMLYRFLEVANSTMNDFGRGSRGSAPEI